MQVIVDSIRTGIFGLATMGAVFGLLAIAVKRSAIIQSIKTVWHEFSTNIGLALVNIVVFTPLFLLPTKPLHEAIGAASLMQAVWVHAGPVLTLACAFLLAEFIVYWRHRIEHHPVLWRFHATHHADTRYHWLTVLRKHPVSLLLAMLGDALILLALGLPGWAIGISGLVRAFWGYLIHADVPWTFGPVGRWLISPAAHRLHHIRDERLMGANFGNTITLWDRVFGTYVDPAPYIDCETGIAEGTRGVLGELLRPFEARYRRPGLATPAMPASVADINPPA